ncbi:MAG: HAMP domain-containing protein [Proteobacteria bacterium]|nr:HAMP domain-containing protein [Pseudomonadota bacterium]
MNLPFLGNILSTIRSRVLVFFIVIIVLLVVGSIAAYKANVENEKINEIAELAYEQRLTTGKISRKSLEYVLAEAPADMYKEIAEAIEKIDRRYLLLSEKLVVEEEKALLTGITEKYKVLKAHIEELLSIDEDDVSVEDGDLLILLDDIIMSNNLAEPDIDALINALYLRAKTSANRPLLIFFSVTIFVVILSIVAFFGTSQLVKRLKEMSAMIEAIAHGKGDLTRRLEISSKDEIGMVGKLFNTFMEGLQKLVRDIFETFNKISSTSHDINRYSSAIINSSRKQMTAVEETSSSIEEMNSSLSSIAGETEEQLQSTEHISSSILEMHASISEVAQSVDNVSLSVDNTASSITEIAASLKEVSSHVDALFEETEGVASATSQVNEAVREIAALAREKALIAEKVKDDASSRGLEAVKKTIAGMERIKEETLATATIISRLEKRSGEIGTILNVIKEVAETTNLLSLNAAIIAAQAGEHGKSFAVVGEEVRGLAKKTSKSTKEIATLINLVQEEMGSAKQSMDNSAARVEEGVILSMGAGEALEAIIERSKLSVEMARKVETATEEQMKSLDLVTKATQRVSSMVEGIKKATDEQMISSDQILHSTGSMKNETDMVKRSTAEQKMESESITKTITDIMNKMKSIAKATSEQRATSEIIVGAVETMRDEIEKNASLSLDLDKTVIELDKQKNSLQEKVESFKV